MSKNDQASSLRFLRRSLFASLFLHGLLVCLLVFITIPSLRLNFMQEVVVDLDLNNPIEEVRNIEKETYEVSPAEAAGSALSAMEPQPIDRPPAQPEKQELVVTTPPEVEEVSEIFDEEVKLKDRGPADFNDFNATSKKLLPVDLDLYAGEPAPEMTAAAKRPDLAPDPTERSQDRDGPKEDTQSSLESVAPAPVGEFLDIELAQSRNPKEASRQPSLPDFKIARVDLDYEQRTSAEPEQKEQEEQTGATFQLKSKPVRPRNIVENPQKTNEEYVENIPVKKAISLLPSGGMGPLETGKGLGSTGQSQNLRLKVVGPTARSGGSRKGASNKRGTVLPDLGTSQGKQSTITSGTDEAVLLLSGFANNLGKPHIGGGTPSETGLGMLLQPLEEIGPLKAEAKYSILAIEDQIVTAAISRYIPERVDSAELEFDPANQDYVVQAPQPIKPASLEVGSLLTSSLKNPNLTSTNRVVLPLWAKSAAAVTAAVVASPTTSNSRDRLNASPGRVILPKGSRLATDIALGVALPITSSLEDSLNASLDQIDLPIFFDVTEVDPFSRRRNPKAREKKIDQLGGSKETELAVVRALEWFKRNQEKDGSWRMRSHDSAATGLVMLAYMGYGAKHTKQGGFEGYQEQLDRAVNWMLSEERDGDMRGSGNMYDHGIAAIAMAEAYYMTKDPRLRPVVRRIVDFTVRAQNPSTGGWRYKPFMEKKYARDSGTFGELDFDSRKRYISSGDMSVTGWQIMALKSAQVGGIEIPAESLDKALKFVKERYGDNSAYGYTQKSNHTPAMAAQGLFCQQMLRAHAIDRGLANPSTIDQRNRESAKYIERHFPDSVGVEKHMKRGTEEEYSYYYWYYASLAMHQQQGEVWKKWNARMSPILLKLQVSGGPDDGSWAPDGKWGREAGQVVATALGTLSLEVYYRYLPPTLVQDANSGK